MIVCRSCGASIEWAITPNGKKMPLDKEPVADGNILVEMRTNCHRWPSLKLTIKSKSFAQANSTGQPHLPFKLINVQTGFALGAND
jgi:hypothetical protein